MNILITGGTGYLGSNLVSKLRKKHRIIILDKTSDKKKIKKIPKNCIFFSGTINKKNLNKIFKCYEIKLILHFAGTIKQKKNKKFDYFRDLKSSICLLEFTKKYKVKYFIFASSCDVYGEKKKLKIKENAKCQPLSYYGKTKYAIENKIKNYLDRSINKYLILRIFNIIGDSHDLKKKKLINTNSLVNNILRKYKNGDTLDLFTIDLSKKDGTCVRDYMSIKQFTEIMLRLISNIDKIETNILNLGSSIGLSSLELLKKIENLLKIKVFYVKKNKKKVDPPFLVANNTKLKKLLKLRSDFFLDIF
jgi:UDP-glucose 4-epimerase